MEQTLKENALSGAMLYIASSGLPLASTPFQRVCEGAETKEFRVEFPDWVTTSNIFRIPDGKAVNFLKSGHRVITSDDYDPADMTEGGSVKVWRVEGTQRVSVAKERYGHFFSKDCYVILYKYPTNDNKEGVMTFYWLGNESTEEDQETAAVLARYTCDTAEGLGLLVRVVEGRENAYFRRMFRGSMVMHKTVQVGEIRTPSTKTPSQPDKKPSGSILSFFKRSKNPDNYGEDNYESLTATLSAKAPKDDDDVEIIELYVVKGNTPMTGHAIQINFNAAELNAVDYFILSTPDVNYVRYPAAAVDDDMHMAYNIATFMSLRSRGVAPKTVEAFNEGKEPEYFWVALGGKKPYLPGYKEVTSSTAVKDPVLYVATAIDGLLTIKRVCCILFLLSNSITVNAG